MKLTEMKKAKQERLVITQRHAAWLEANPDAKYSEEAVEFARRALSNELGGNRKRKIKWRASGTESCQRARILNAFNYTARQTVDARSASIFQTGNFGHLRWQMAGLTEGWLVEAELPFERPDLGLSGTMDGLCYDGSGFEFKTINDNGFRNVLKFGPQRKHIAQMHAYMLLGDLDAFSVVYESKNDQEWREFRVERNPEIIAAIERDLSELNEYYEKRELPPVLTACQTTPDRYCKYKNVCLEARL